MEPANISDANGARILLSNELKARYPKIEKVWVDSAYQGPLEGEINQRLGWELEVVRRRGQRGYVVDQRPPPPVKGFRVQQWRWIVERTIGWVGRCRRLAKDFEATTESSQAWMYAAMIGLMLRRLT